MNEEKPIAANGESAVVEGSDAANDPVDVAQDSAEVDQVVQEVSEENGPEVVEDAKQVLPSGPLVVKVHGFSDKQLQDRVELNNYLYNIFVEEIGLTEPPLFSFPWCKGVFVKIESPKDKEIYISALRKNRKQYQKNFKLNWATLSSPHPTSARLPASDAEAEELRDSYLIFRNVPYKKELEIKKKELEVSVLELAAKVEPHLQAKNKGGPVKWTQVKPRVIKMEPYFPFYAYRTTTFASIIEDKTTGDYVVGICNGPSEKILPIKYCEDLSPPVVTAIQNFVDFAKKEKITVFDSSTCTGLVTGLLVQMNRTGEIILTVTLCRDEYFGREFDTILPPADMKPVEADFNNDPAPDEFKFIYQDKRTQTDSTNLDKKLYSKQLKTIQPSLQKYFDEEAGKVGVVSIYVSWAVNVLHPGLPKPNKPHPNVSCGGRVFYHFVGAKRIEDCELGTRIGLIPSRIWSPRPVFVPVCGVLVKELGLDKNHSLVVLACDYQDVLLIISEKCKAVISLNTWDENYLAGWNMKNVVRAKMNPPSAIPNMSPQSQVIIWDFSITSSFLKKMGMSGVQRLVFVGTNFKTDVFQKLIMMAADHQYALNSVRPADYLPRTKNYCFVASFSKVVPKMLLSELVNRKRKIGEEPQPDGADPKKRPRRTRVRQRVKVGGPPGPIRALPNIQPFLPPPAPPRPDFAGAIASLIQPQPLFNQSRPIIQPRGPLTQPPDFNRNARGPGPEPVSMSTPNKSGARPNYPDNSFAALLASGNPRERNFGSHVDNDRHGPPRFDDQSDRFFRGRNEEWLDKRPDRQLSPGPGRFQERREPDESFFSRKRDEELFFRRGREMDEPMSDRIDRGFGDRRMDESRADRMDRGFGDRREQESRFDRPHLSPRPDEMSDDDWPSYPDKRTNPWSGGGPNRIDRPFFETRNVWDRPDEMRAGGPPFRPQRGEETFFRPDRKSPPRVEDNMRNSGGPHFQQRDWSRRWE